MNEREQLEKEIDRLRHELSVTIPQEMQTAIESGDLRENSEFSDAVSRQYFASIRLKQLIDRLSSFSAVQLQTISKTSVGVGSIIKTKHVEENKTMTFKMVIGEITDDISEEYTEITLHSPIGKALHNKEVKDQVTVVFPSGKATYKILNIKTLHDL